MERFQTQLQRIPGVALLVLLLLHGISEARQPSTKPQWHKPSRTSGQGGYLSVGPNFNVLNLDDRRYPYVDPLPAHNVMPPVDFLVKENGWVYARRLTLLERGQPARDTGGASGRHPIEETHPSDPPIPFGPMYPTRLSQPLRISDAVWWDGSSWRQGPAIVYMWDEIRFVFPDGGIVRVRSEGVQVQR